MEGLVTAQWTLGWLMFTSGTLSLVYLGLVLLEA